MCAVKGHPCDPTGRHANLLYEHRCRRCGGFYVSHVHYGSILIGVDAESNRIFEDIKAYVDNTKA